MKPWGVRTQHSHRVLEFEIWLVRLPWKAINKAIKAIAPDSHCSNPQVDTLVHQNCTTLSRLGSSLFVSLMSTPIVEFIKASKVQPIYFSQKKPMYWNKMYYSSFIQIKSNLRLSNLNHPFFYFFFFNLRNRHV